MTRQFPSLALALGLAALTIVGHASAIHLIAVKSYPGYQHYQTWSWLAHEWPLAVWGVLAQVVIVTIVGWRLRARLREMTASLGSARVWIGVAILVGFSLAVPAGDAAQSIGEVLLAGGLALLAMLNLALAVLAVPDSALASVTVWVETRLTLRSGSSETRPWDRTLPLAVALWVAILAALASVVVFERVPHIEDGVSNLFQARYFAAGLLYLPAPPDTESFQVAQTIVDATKWYGYAFPAWPLVLSIGVRLGAPWLVNPILGGLLILVGHAVIRRRYDRGTANLVVLTLSMSPWLIFMSAEYMAHPLTAVLALLAALAFDHATAGEPRAWRWALIAGLAMGGVLLTRALDGVILVLALGVTGLIDRRLPRAWATVGVAGVLALMVALLIFPYSKALTGRATYPPHMAWSDARWGPGVDRMGFGADVGIPAWRNLDPLPGHGPADVVLNLNKNVFMTNIDLFGWACGSLLFVWFALAIGRWRRADALMLTVVVTQILGYSAYWFSGGPDLGARYWYPLLVPFAALSVRGVQMIVTAASARDLPPQTAPRLGAFIVMATLSATVVMLPWRATTKYYRYRGISSEVRKLAAAYQFGHALVFVRTDEKASDYTSAFNLNPGTLDDVGTVYAFDAGPGHREAVVGHFPDRPVWVISPVRLPDGPHIRFVVSAGPLPPRTVPKQP